MTIGEIIKKKRLEKGISQRELARHLGVSNVQVCYWEKDYCMPLILNCWDLADFFECTIDELCGRIFKESEK